MSRAALKIAHQYENERYEMSPELAKSIKIVRVSDGGFQRELSKKRVEQIRKDLEKRGASDYPEITVANVSGVLQCVDGQHRLLAHIEANVPIPVRVMSMTQEQAIVLFCRDNGKARPLMRRDLIASSLVPAAKTIRHLAADYKAHLGQITNLFIGIKGGSSIGDLHDSATGFTDPEIRAATMVLEEWSKSKLWAAIDSRRAPEKLRYSEVRAYSSGNTLWCLGKLVHENLKNLSAARKQVRLIQEADWSSNRGNSLRKLATAGTMKRGELLEAMKANILLPAYSKEK